MDYDARAVSLSCLDAQKYALFSASFGLTEFHMKRYGVEAMEGVMNDVLRSGV